MTVVLSLRSIETYALSPATPADSPTYRLLVHADGEFVRSFLVPPAGELWPFVPSDHAEIYFGNEATINIYEYRPASGVERNHGTRVVRADELDVGERAADFNDRGDSHFRLTYFVVAADLEPRSTVV